VNTAMLQLAATCMLHLKYDSSSLYGGPAAEEDRRV